MEPPISFGAIADLQYCDAEPEINRYFRNAPQKLKSAINEFNCHKLDFIINPSLWDLPRLRLRHRSQPFCQRLPTLDPPLGILRFETVPVRDDPF